MRDPFFNQRPSQQARLLADEGVQRAAKNIQRLKLLTGLIAVLLIGAAIVVSRFA